MIALLFIVFVIPMMVLVGVTIVGCSQLVNAVYDVGTSLYEGRKPVNKYKQ